MLDIKSYLDDKGIDYQSEGKNVSPGWIELNCPWCDDPSYHLGISPTMFYHCWRCGTKGYVTAFVMEIENCNYHQAEKIIRGYFLNEIEELKTDIRLRLSDNIIPKEASKNFPQIHLDYLKSRNFNSSELIQTYNLYSCYNIGDYKFRIIIPIIEEGRIINFTAMAVMGQSPKYIHCNNESAIIPMKHCLYNIDTVRDKAIIVEGVTDVWRLGNSTIATMGIEYTSEQIQLILSKNLSECYVMFDSEEQAIKKAHKLATILSVSIPKVEVIELSTGDPGELTQQQVSEIRSNIFGG